ncbi:MAG: choice-of-anchor B family protein [Bacteroidetes bacterium]|nr:choice-of-anchor B family protein [Bacteroidota bacterium]
MKFFRKHLSKIYWLLAGFILCKTPSSAQLNLTQQSLLSFPGQRVAGVWHYVDSLNHEYALVGTEHGISIVDVTNPASPNFILQVPGISNLWHEVKTWGRFAYATTEGIDTNGINDGLQIIDLRYLPDSAPAHYWHGDGLIAGQLHKAHTLEMDNGFVYINGHNIFSLGRGVIIADLADPLNPHYVGAETLNYCHDSFIRGDTLWTSDLNAGFSVFDISNKSSPVFLANQATPGNFNHNAWLSDNSHTLFTTDEHNHAPLAAFDVTDLNNISLLDKYSVGQIVNSNYFDEVHNVRVLNDFLVNACYGSQVTIVDASRPSNLVEVGNFPILTGLSWDVDPYLPSGNILATGETTGLYVLSPNYVRACFLEGVVTDSLTNFPINLVHVEIQSVSLIDSTDFTGVYQTGYHVAGSYSVRYSKPGYITKTIHGVVLSNGNLTMLNVQLVPDLTDVNEKNNPDEVSVFPNPFFESSNLFVSGELLEQFGPFQFEIKDVTGRPVVRIKQVDETRTKISGRNFSAGIYFYELRNETGFSRKGKIVME